MRLRPVTSSSFILHACMHAGCILLNMQRVCLHSPPGRLQ